MNVSWWRKDSSGKEESDRGISSWRGIVVAIWKYAGKSGKGPSFYFKLRRVGDALLVDWQPDQKSSCVNPTPSHEK